MADGAIPGIRLRKRLRQDPYTTQRPPQLSEELMMSAVSPLDAEISAAVHEKRPINVQQAFPDIAAQELSAELEGASPDRSIDCNDHIGVEAPFVLRDEPIRLALALSQLGDAQGKKELQFRMMHRLLQRQLPMTSIATVMGISLRSAYRLREKLKQRYRAETRDQDASAIAGEAKWFYDECIATALRWMSDASLPISERMQALRLADTLMTSKYRFMHMAGYFTDSPFAPTRMAQAATEADQVDGTLRLLSNIIAIAMAAPAAAENAPRGASELGDTSI